ncbi:DUF3310 domain-containing protein [Neisseria sp. P0001.S004]|uniref:DUF3310 domain-containing protein n=1 Tax=Neisseria sp. P0001.S005 TaxID=3436649 RepID=UPI003F7E4294
MEKDNINPAHYRQQPYECIEFTENMNFNLGNAFKYIWRYQDKNGTEDLKKARWYLQRQLECSPLYSLLGLELCKDLSRKLEECRRYGKFVVGQYLLLVGILSYSFCEDSKTLSNSIEILDDFIKRIECDEVGI